MKARLILLLVLTLGFAGSLTAAPTETAPPRPDSRLPGVSLAEGASQITGTAVSPLLGVSAIGAWKYAMTPAPERHLLPWYCRPWVWGTCFAVLAVCFLKDFLGAAAPPLVKKPLDFIELFEDKASALVASAAFVPLVTTAMAHFDATPSPTVTTAASGAQMGLAMVPGVAAIEITWIKMALYTPLALLAFGIVWLSSHAINVLIALSPFGIVDAGLKLVKLMILGLIAGSAFIHPVLGLIVCGLVIIPACFVAGPAFRLMVFGNVFGWDLLCHRRACGNQLSQGVRSFNSARLGRTPARSYGTLVLDRDGRLVFRYRPWLVLPVKEVVPDDVPDGLAQGLLFPSLTSEDIPGRPRNAFLLLPRYRACIQEVGARFGITKVVDSSLMRGFKAMRRWLVEALSVGRGRLAAVND